MSIITLTAALYCESEQLINAVSKELEYELLGNEIIDLTAKEFNVPKNKIEKAIYEAPLSAIQASTEKVRFITYLQTTLIRQLLKNNITYYGPAAFVLVQGISHVLKVRLIASLENRIKAMMKSESKSAKEVEKIIIKRDKEYSKWSEFIFKADISNPNLYDLVINLDQIEIPQAIDIIINTINSKRFQPMTYSINCLKDTELALTIKSRLLDIDPNIMVKVKSGMINIDTLCQKKNSDKRIKQIHTIVDQISDSVNIDQIRIIEDELEVMS